MFDDLLLLSGNDIPFPQAQMTIHQPTIKEIAYIGEENFFTGYQFINISKNLFSEEDKVNLEDKSNFDILIAILRERNAVMQKNRNCVLMLLSLLFPAYHVEIEEDSISFKNEEEEHYINNNNFEDFKSIFKEMFNFGKKDEDVVNPSGDMAKKIAEKLRKRHQTLAEQGKENQKIDIISRYASILATGQQLNINLVFNYTIYQLIDQIQRYQLKMSYDINLKARMAGAKDLEEIEDWMKDIHS